MTQGSNPNKSRRLRRALTATTVAAVAAAVLASGHDSAPKPNKGGGDGKQDIVPTVPGEYRSAHEQEEIAARAVAEGLESSLRPYVPVENKGGGGGPNGLIIMDGELRAYNTSTGEGIQVNDPIVPTDGLPLSQLPGSWIVTQEADKDGDGAPEFEAVDLSKYDFVTITPEDETHPYRITYGTSQPVKGGPVPGSAQYRMFECDSTGTVPDMSMPSVPGGIILRIEPSTTQ